MVKNLKRLNDKLTRRIPEAVRRAAQEGVEKGAEKITNTARTFAPYRTGDLRRSIGYTMDESELPEGSLSLTRRGKKDPEDVVATIYAGSRQAFYARWVEFGTVKWSGHPFFFPAYRLEKRGAKGGITRAYRKAIKEGAK